MEKVKTSLAVCLRGCSSHAVEFDISSKQECLAVFVELLVPDSYRDSDHSTRPSFSIGREERWGRGGGGGEGGEAFMSKGSLQLHLFSSISRSESLG